MRPLDLARFPLQGVRLIEASAGTGKTYTIANLYLRLVLERGLEVPRILVVTFTNAATEELRSRIRRRLSEARDALASNGADDESDLGRLLRDITDRAEAARHLDEALTRMDEVAVFTIHGFAQRMLTEHAFESGTPFETELLGDEYALRRNAVEDFWRRRFYEASRDDMVWANTEWGTPEGLYKQISGLLGRDSARLLPENAPDRIKALEKRWHLLRARLAEQWKLQGESACALLLDGPSLNRNSYRPGTVEQAITAFNTWLAGAPPGLLPARFDLFTPAKLASATRKGHDTPTDLLFELCGEIDELAPELARLRRAALLTEVVNFTREAVLDHKRARNQVAYDDLLTRLDEVLRGTEASVLSARVRACYPVAMIDEFQDTDPLQYRIFRSIYAHEARLHKGKAGELVGEEATLFMIGDPKQAIYGFRGADIFAYLKAKREACESAYTLETNWRSSSALVDAVNRLFSACTNPFLFEEIEFHPVRPSPNADDQALTIEGKKPAPFACWMLPRQGDKSLQVGEARRLAAAACAHEVARLLKLSTEGVAYLGPRPLAAHDLAILVRDRFEAAVVRTALDEAGVASVFLSRDSVFATPEAEAVRRLLRAVAEPGDVRALRAALATDLIGADATALEALNREEDSWETWLARFHAANQRWREHGFMSMFTQLIVDCGITHRVLADHGGERRMTNLLQLAELLMAADDKRNGFESVLRWMDMRIDEPNGDDEAEQLRLESEESLVQVVTVHASKGLEYNLVFLPFPWSVRNIDPVKTATGTMPILFHAKNDLVLCADLGTDVREENAHLAERERLAEDLRLLYVALTRARQRVYLSWGGVTGAKDAALARLLHGRRGMASLDDAAIRSDLLDLNGGVERLALCELPRELLRAPAAPSLSDQQARQFAGRIDASWRVTSYSGLIAGPFERAELPDYDGWAEVGIVPSMPMRLQQDAFAFPRGPQAGLFLHALLEKLDFPQAHGDALTEAVRAGLQLHGFDANWQEPIEGLVRSVLDTPLDEKGLRLRMIRRSDRRDELAFYYPLTSLEAKALDMLITRYGSLELQGERLSFSPVRGMMRGFIDLMFRHDGRYYLADYKSNHLGDCAEDYAPPRLAEAMREHRYDLQYLIYCVALHRHLRTCLPGYLYARDFGGVYYLFLRGMKPDYGPRAGVWFDRPEPALIEALDTLFSGRADLE